MADDKDEVEVPEVPATLTTRDIITALVKDDDDAARAAFHQVLQVKMRDRISPAEKVETPDEVEVSDE